MSDAIVKSALNHWGFQGTSCHLIAARENYVYRVDTQTRPVALRLHRPGLRSQAELISELEWMAVLARGGISVPAPIPSLDGSIFAQFDDTFVDVVTWLEGDALTQSPTPQAYHGLGKTMARCHEITNAWTPPSHFTRPLWDADGLVGDAPLWGPFWENPTLSPAQKTRLEAFRDQARNVLNEGTFDVGLIHADLVPENVLTCGDTLRLIDFDDGGFGYRLFDLATVTHRSRRNDPTGALARAVVDGYKTERDIDLTHLPLFEALRACTYIGWITPRLSEDGAPARNNRFIAEAFDCFSRLSGVQNERS
ncbi:phosphotransferase enzyme family protein [Pseudorhodobacter sp. W20_MBD10_FR17]|uniref:phosphotransferase enzyme family protein n=1 Tax=Pseudorhodobacter sp. W20_MBD10_FR17 TaxID=3240266 RepID=UPI003F9D2DFD